MLIAAQQYIEDRIERVPECGCWLWTKSLKGKGYGQCFFGGVYWYSHHLAWEAYRGPRNSLHVLHHCDVKTCCNPNHLFLGTNDDNIKDMVNKRRHKHGVTHSMVKLTEQQVREIRQSIGPEPITAQRYGVSRALIGMIRRREVWTHLDDL